MTISRDISTLARSSCNAESRVYDSGMAESFYPRIYPSDAEVRIARRLFEELERMDQTHLSPLWSDLAESEQSLYILALRKTLRGEATAVLRYLADQGVKNGRAEISE